MSATVTAAQDLARRVVLADLISKDAATLKKAASAALMEEVGPGVTIHAVTDDGRDCATVSVTMPKPAGDPKPEVTDREALVRWLACEEPEAVEMRPKDWWVNDLAGWIERHGGELPPGVEMVQPAGKKPYVSVSRSKAQREVLESMGLVDAIAQIEAGDAQ